MKGYQSLIENLEFFVIIAESYILVLGGGRRRPGDRLATRISTRTSMSVQSPLDQSCTLRSDRKGHPEL